MRCAHRESPLPLGEGLGEGRDQSSAAHPPRIASTAGASRHPMLLGWHGQTRFAHADLRQSRRDQGTQATQRTPSSLSPSVPLDSKWHGVPAIRDCPCLGGGSSNPPEAPGSPPDTRDGRHWWVYAHPNASERTRRPGRAQNGADHSPGKGGRFRGPTHACSQTQAPRRSSRSDLFAY